MVNIRLPNRTQRLAIIGKTGTGKTQAAAWHLANKPVDKERWIILDFKRDALLDAIPGAQILALGKIPKRPGVYIVQPRADEDEAVEAYLWQIWEAENVGLFIDEGYMLGTSKAFRAVLTQGRSKRIPMIILTQRPSFISRFVFTEADFLQVFYLTDREDHKRVRSFMRYDFDTIKQDYHSVYHDVGRNQTVKLTPAPDEETIMALFESKIGKRPRFI